MWTQGIVDMTKCSVSTRFVDMNAYHECDYNAPSFGFSLAYNIIYDGIGIWFFLAFLVHKWVSRRGVVVHYGSSCLIVTLLILTLFWPRGDSLLRGLSSLASSRTRHPPSKQHQSSLTCQKKLTLTSFTKNDFQGVWVVAHHQPHGQLSLVLSLQGRLFRLINKSKPLRMYSLIYWLYLFITCHSCYYIDIRKIIKSLFHSSSSLSSSSSSPSSFSFSSSSSPSSSFSFSPSDTAL